MELMADAANAFLSKEEKTDDERVLHAVLTIQKNFRAYKRRKARQSAILIGAAVRIQSVFRGFKARKKYRDFVKKGDKTNICDGDTLQAALKLQSGIRAGGAKRVDDQVPRTPKASFDSSSSSGPASPVPSSSGPASPVPSSNGQPDDEKDGQIFATTSESENETIDAKSVTSDDDDKTPTKDEEKTVIETIEAKKTLLKKQSIIDMFKGQTESASATNGDSSKPKEEPKSKLGGFFSMFKKAEKAPQPTPQPVQQKPQPQQAVPQKPQQPPQPVQQKEPPKQPEQQKEPAKILPPPSQQPKEEKIETAPAKPEPKPVTPPPTTSKEAMKQKDKPAKLLRKQTSDSSETESEDDNDMISRDNSIDLLDDEPKKGFKSSATESATDSDKDKKEAMSKSASADSADSEKVKSKAVSKTASVESEEDLKKDLIHKVLTAVEENWLNQAPKPTLDKVKALQAPDSDPELENSERSTSEADYIKKKLKAQKSKDLGSDDEGAQLWRQESADGEFPYIETTLPQERSGTVAITPSKQRLSDQCKLSSIERPRSMQSQTQPGKLDNFARATPSTKPVASVADPKKVEDKIKVKLPHQLSKSKMLVKSKSDVEGKAPRARTVPKNLPLTGASRKQMPARQMSAAAVTTKSDWVDCEKLPEAKKTVKKYSTSDSARKRLSGEFPDGHQTSTTTHRHSSTSSTGAQDRVVSPEECSCECHHESPVKVISPTSATSMFARGLSAATGVGVGAGAGSSNSSSSGGAKPKVNPRTSSITARSKPIVSQKSSDRLASAKTTATKTTTAKTAVAKTTSSTSAKMTAGSSTKTGMAAARKTSVEAPGSKTVSKAGPSATPKGSPPPPVPIRTTSVSKSKNAR